jgi:hypothetical protein
MQMPSLDPDVAETAFGIRPRFEFRHDVAIRAKEAAPEFGDLS